jgi:hypothetical protein
VSRVRYRDVVNGVETLANNQAVTLYPQPATNAVTVVNPFVGDNNVQLIIHDVTGRLLTQRAAQQSKLFNVDVNDFPAGVYLMTLQSGDKTFTRRLAVTR